jgi:CubicO group peptidase (beta-lactamase class C family)
MRAILAIFCLAMTAGCILETSDLKLPFESLTPVENNDGWRISSPAAEGIDPEKLAAIYRDFHTDRALWMVRSLLIVRNGRLVGESYTKDPADLNDQRAIWSCTKQYLGVLIGIALDQKLIASLDDPIGRYLPAELARHPDKRDITIKNLLMMQSGLRFQNFGIGGDDDLILRQDPPDLLEFVLSKEMVTTPGTQFDYKDSDPQILSAVLKATSGMEPRDWAERVLFAKIGSKNIRWLPYRDGSTIGAFGLMTTPRELARFAQLVLDQGVHNGERVVSADWLAEMVKPHVKTSDKSFGYQWWSLAPEHDVPFMSGSGRQIVFLFPDKQLLVVMTSEENTQGRFMLGTLQAFAYADRIAQIAK